MCHNLNNYTRERLSYTDYCVIKFKIFCIIVARYLSNVFLFSPAGVSCDQYPLTLRLYKKKHLHSQSNNILMGKTVIEEVPSPMKIIVLQKCYGAPCGTLLNPINKTCYHFTR